MHRTIKRTCLICGISITKRNPCAKYCKECAREKDKMYKRRYYWKRRDVALKIQKKWREDNKEQKDKYNRRHWKAMNIYKKESNEKYGGNKKWQDIK